MLGMAKTSTTKRPRPERDPESMTGAEFRAARKKIGLSQTELADAMGLHIRTVVRMEAAANRRRDVPLSNAKHIRCLARERRVKLG